MKSTSSTPIVSKSTKVASPAKSSTSSMVVPQVASSKVFKVINKSLGPIDKSIKASKVQQEQPPKVPAKSRKSVDEVVKEIEEEDEVFDLGDNEVISRPKGIKRKHEEASPALSSADQLILKNFDAQDWIEGGKYYNKINQISHFMKDHFLSLMRKYSKSISGSIYSRQKAKERIVGEIESQQQKLKSGSPQVDKAYYAQTIKRHKESLEKIEDELEDYLELKDRIAAALPKKSSKVPSKEDHPSKRARHESATEEDDDVPGTIPNAGF